MPIDLDEILFQLEARNFGADGRVTIDLYGIYTPSGQTPGGQSPGGREIFMEGLVL